MHSKNQIRAVQTHRYRAELMMIGCILWLFAGRRASAFTVGDPHLVFSPYNWSFQSSTYAVTNEPGAYLIATFQGSAQATLHLEMSGVPVSYGYTSLTLQCSVDGALLSPQRLTAANTLTLVSGLNASQPHTLQVWLLASDITLDRWNLATGLPTGLFAPAQSLRVTGLTLDAGGTLLSPANRPTRRILFFGDSISEGYKNSPTSNALAAFPVRCAQKLHAEYGVVGNSGQGWTQTNAPASNVPVFREAWVSDFMAQPRFSPGVGTPMPDYIVVNHGTNDAYFTDPLTGLHPPADATQVGVAALDWLNLTRAVAGNTTRIFVVVPFGGFYESALQSAVQQYQTANPQDSRVTLIDLGWSAQRGLTTLDYNGTPQSYDGIHPNAATAQILGVQLAAAIQTALGQHDFNGDGESDLVFRNSSTGQIAFWYMNGANLLGGGLASQTPPVDWQPVGVGDFNGDGKADLVLQNQTTRSLGVWYINGTTVQGGALINTKLPAGWTVVGVGDFNDDEQPDLVLQNSVTNQVGIWYMQGTNVVAGQLVNLTSASGYQVVGVGDFNLDGKPDFVFQNKTTGRIVVWYLNGASFLDGGFTASDPPAGYRIAAIGDYNGDGRPDIVMQNGDGTLLCWFMEDRTCHSSQTLNTYPGTLYRVVAPH